MRIELRSCHQGFRPTRLTPRARRKSGREDVVDHIHRIRDVGVLVAVVIAGRNVQGCLSAGEDVIDEVYYIGYVDLSATVGIPANELTCITDSVAIVIFLPGV